jgi:hypothetical protein
LRNTCAKDSGICVDNTAARRPAVCDASAHDRALPNQTESRRSVSRGPAARGRQALRAACDEADFYARLPDFAALALDKPTLDWLIRAADVDVRVLMIAFGV